MYQQFENLQETNWKDALLYHALVIQELETPYSYTLEGDCNIFLEADYGNKVVWNDVSPKPSYATLAALFPVTRQWILETQPGMYENNAREIWIHDHNELHSLSQELVNILAVIGPQQGAIADAAADAITNYNTVSTLLGALVGAVNIANTKQNELATKINSILTVLREHGLIAN